uniref:Uncharacterized protein n=1 Tax=Arundo donax TaxID=35708 RepID=A0A0A9GHH3_ARUDO
MPRWTVPKVPRAMTPLTTSLAGSISQSSLRCCVRRGCLPPPRWSAPAASSLRFSMVQARLRWRSSCSSRLLRSIWSARTKPPSPPPPPPLPPFMLVTDTARAGSALARSRHKNSRFRLRAW